MTGVRRVVPLTLGYVDLPAYVLEQGGPADEVRAPIPGVLLECDGGWLLLDTGFNTALVTDRALRRRFHGDRALRPVIPGPGEPLDEELDRAGIDIGRIYAVALSHLHWDHAGGVRHFAGRVPVHLQRAEHEYATQPGPEPAEHGMFRIDYDDPAIDWRFAAGDTELAPGVTAVLTAGHTPGHQSFVVDLAGGGGFVFAFDAANTTRGCEHEVPGGLIGVTREEGAAQIRKLKRLAAERGYQLIPGHDPVAWPALAASLAVERPPDRWERPGETMARLRFPVTEVRVSYLDYSGRSDRLSGGARRIPVDTPAGQFTVWTKRIGNNPDLKVLLLHGGPGATHEYLEACDSFLPAAGIEYYYYDQLGSGRSDQPDDPSLWELDRFVDEVEQVRQALELDRGNFVLYGQSWGGILALEYALHHQEHLRGLVISNMMASAPAYTAYAEQVLMPAMDPAVLAEIKALEAAGDIENPRYMELLIPNYYEQHLMRMPAGQWPDPLVRGLSHINQKIYVPMQGPSELGMSADAKLANWDRVADLPRIEVPTLVIGARYDTMDPAHMEMMAGRLPKGRYLYCRNGSHCAMYDDQDTYFAGLTDFLATLPA